MPETAIRTLIVDDEHLARARVRALLQGEPGVEIVAECPDGRAAVEAIERHRPDLMFLDVQMPHLDGFEVIEAVGPELLPVVIFTTAYDEHALRAFEVNALDYLLKPFKEARFRKSMERARALLKERRGAGEETQLRPLLAYLQSRHNRVPRILVKSPDRVLFLRADEIEYLEAAGNYVVVHAAQERHIVRETMAALEKRLAEAGFMRVSRSAMVNLHRVREAQPVEAGTFCLLLRSGARLSMTCSLRDLQDRMDAL